MRQAQKVAAISREANGLLKGEGHEAGKVSQLERQVARPQGKCPWGHPAFLGVKHRHLETRQSPWGEVGFGVLRPSSVLQLGSLCSLWCPGIPADSLSLHIAPHLDSVAAGSSFPP